MRSALPRVLEPAVASAFCVAQESRLGSSNHDLSSVAAAIRIVVAFGILGLAGANEPERTRGELFTEPIRAVLD